MNCPNCGAANGAESKFCVTCGTPLPTEAPVVEAAPEIIPEVAPETVTPDVEAPVTTPENDSVLTKIKAAVEPVIAPLKPYLSNKKVQLGLGAVAAVAVIAIILCVVLGLGNGFISYDSYVMPMQVDDEYALIVDNKVLETKFEAESLSSYKSNIDGKISAAIARYEDGNELFVLKGKKVVSVAKDVADFELSVTGKGLAYLVANEDAEDGENYTLYLYNISTGKSTKVSNKVRNTIFAISPDGASVAYYIPGEENPQLMYAKGSKETKITSSDVDLYGLSNNGKYIYASEVRESENGNEEVLYSYNTKGVKSKLGKIGSSTVRFNYAHTQILFYNESKSYISTNGKEAVKASSDSIRLIVAPNAATFSDGLSYTYPVKDLYGHVYAVSGDTTSAWIIKKNADKSIKLVSKISSYSLDMNAEYLYYIYDGDELRVIKLSHGDRAGEKFVTLAEDVDNYVVTSDAKKVFYVADDGLYVINGKKGGKSKTIVSDDVKTSLAINKKDVVYYVVDEDLYATTGGKGTKVLSDYEAMTDTPNGLVYAMSDGKLYVSNGSKKLTKILDVE